MKMNNNKILVEIENLFSKDEVKSISVPVILDHWKSKDISNSSLNEFLSVPEINMDKSKCFKILEIFIKNGYINDFIVNSICDLLKNNLYLFDEKGFICSLIDLLDYINISYTEVSQEQLRKLVSTLEFLYARGLTDFVEQISKLIDRIKYNEFDENGNDSLRCKLAVVYTCNIYNYKKVGMELDSIIKKCKKAGLSHFKGMFYYYFAVYSFIVESCDKKYKFKQYGLTDSEYFIKKAKNKGFSLAKDFYII